MEAFLTLEAPWSDERKWRTPHTQRTMQALSGRRSDKLTLSPLFSLLQLGQTADLSGDSPIIGPALRGEFYLDGYLFSAISATNNKSKAVLSSGAKIFLRWNLTNLK